MLYRILATLELDAVDKSLVYIQVFVGEFALTILFSVASKNCVISSSLLSFVLGFVEVVRCIVVLNNSLTAETQTQLPEIT